MIKNRRAIDFIADKIAKKKIKTKAQMMWDVSKEQEEIFRENITEIVNGINTEDFFKLIRGVEYRRGKEDGIKQGKQIAIEEVLELIRKIFFGETDVPFGLEGECDNCDLNYIRLKELKQFIQGKKEVEDDKTSKNN